MRTEFFVFAPDESSVSGGSAAPAAAPAPAPSAQAAPSPDPVATDPRNDLPRESTAVSQETPAHADAAQPAQAGQTQAAAPASQDGSFRDAARQYGLDLSQYPDDYSALQALVSRVNQAEQMRQLAEYGQVYLQNADAFRRWQEERAQQSQPEQQKFWNPPEWKPEWSNLLTRDENGNVTLVPGAPAEILQKYHAHEQYKRDFANRFISNPEEALGPMIESRAQAIAEKLINGNLQSYQDRVWADNFVSQNSHWLHQRDPAGNVISDPITKQPVLTPEGVRYREYVVLAERSGVRDIRQMDFIARSLLERDIAIAQLRAAKVGQANDQIKNNLLLTQNRAMHQPNSGGSLGGGSPNPGQQISQNKQLSLADRLRRDLASNGIKDGDFAASGRP